MGDPLPARRRAAVLPGAVRGLVACLALLYGPASAGDELTLRYRLHEGDRTAYARAATVTGTFRIRAGEPMAPETSLRIRAEIRGLTTQEVKDTLPDGSYRILERHRLAVSVNGRPIPVPAIGPAETRLTPLGIREGGLSATLADLAPFGLGLPDLLPGVVIQFPPDPVRVGSRWHTRAEWMLPGQQDAVTTADSRLVTIKEHEGQPCALISSQVRIPPLRLGAAPPSPPNAGAEGGAAGDGHLKLQGAATGEAFHALHTGEPLYSRMRVRLSVEAEGISTGSEPAATGSGELEILIECRRVPPETTALPAPQAARSTAPAPAKPAPTTPSKAAAASGLRILRPTARERVQGELALDCRVSLAGARYALIRIDGAACVAVNAPYRHRVDVSHLSPGEHVLEVAVYSAEGAVLAEGRQVFVVAKDR